LCFFWIKFQFNVQACFFVENRAWLTRLDSWCPSQALGHLLCLVLFLVLVAVAGAMLMQVAAMAHNLARARRCGRVLRRLPQSDPPHGSDAFYLIQVGGPGLSGLWRVGGMCV
jgi:hypothetical protein